MKMSRVFLVLGFIMIMALYSDAQPIGLQSEDCCFSFFTGKIPPKKILDVKKIGSHCSQQGFIVTTPEYPTEAIKIFGEVESCCFWHTGSIPAEKILNVKKIGSHCPQQGFIVTTPKFSGLCVREISVQGQQES
ncbi:hypothetical protein QTP70_025517 [Hemibagrus guttatus]|uniref:Chemokine interleukin-8-like domain-containing protein n=1 Tax=Hemibagrus guttatus TaxID=175788 RepID=A0AAE0QZL0_9TELE|nr:hypothetical protein QTP70_025517 [Hemibagrus guttatus]